MKRLNFYTRHYLTLPIYSRRQIVVVPPTT